MPFVYLAGIRDIDCKYGGFYYQSVNNLNNVSYFRNPAVQGIELCLSIDMQHSFPRHSHEDFYAVGLMNRGGNSWNGSFDEGSFVKPGDIAVINPGQVHSGIPRPGECYTYTMMYISNDAMQKFSRLYQETADVLPEFESVIISDSELSAGFGNLVRVVRSSVDSLEAETAGLEFISRLIKGYTASSGGPVPSSGNVPALRRAADLLSSELDRKIGLEEAAAEAGLSSYHFLRTFKQHYGVSPHTYRIQKRLSAAGRLIRSGMSFSEVALAAGFSDQSHLTNTFRTYTGATPRQYQNSDSNFLQ